MIKIKKFIHNANFFNSVPYTEHLINANIVKKRLVTPQILKTINEFIPQKSLTNASIAINYLVHLQVLKAINYNSY